MIRGNLLRLKALVRPYRCNYLSITANKGDNNAENASFADRRYAMDITGNTYSCSPHGAFPRMDDGIMSIITDEKDSSTIMRECIAADPSCALAHILLLFESTRHGTTRELNKPEGNKEEGKGGEAAVSLSTSLHVLAELARSGKGVLTPREQYLSCAVEAWLRGQYTRAALVLERLMVVSDCRHDLLVLKLCQEAWIQAGQPRKVLTCVTESGYLLDEEHLLYGDVLALHAIGLNEMGLWAEAEKVL